MLELKNYAGSTILLPLSVSGTEVQVQTADAGKFPALSISGDIFRARLRDNAGNYEYVTATARAGNLITIERGAEGTTPKEFAAGSSFELVVTAGAWDLMAESRWVRPRDASRNLLIPTRLSATSFSLPGDLTSMFVHNRALRLKQNAPASGYVASSSYASGLTTVQVANAQLDAGLYLVELGLEVDAAPKYGDAANADTLGGSTKTDIISAALAPVLGAFEDAWDFLVGEGTIGVAIKKSLAQVKAALCAMVGAYTRQQHAVPIELATGLSGAIALDAIVHQEVVIPGITGAVSFALPANGQAGMYITVLAWANNSSNVSVTWANGYLANADGLPSTLYHGKWTQWIFRCITPGVWFYLGESRAA